MHPGRAGFAARPDFHSGMGGLHVARKQAA